MTIFQLTSKIKEYLNTQINSMALENPLMGFAKPLITRMINNNIYKVNNTLSLLADSEGNIDIENILSEMLDSLVATKPFTIQTSFIGEIEIGGGEIKLNLPFTNNRLVLNKVDIEQFKDMLTIKN